MIVTLHKREVPLSERFHVRWTMQYQKGKILMVPAGYAVYDGDRRITNTWRTRAEAERHRDNIMVLYARYGW